MQSRSNFAAQHRNEKPVPLFMFVASFMAASLMAIAVLAFGTTV